MYCETFAAGSVVKVKHYEVYNLNGRIDITYSEVTINRAASPLSSIVITSTSSVHCQRLGIGEILFFSSIGFTTNYYDHLSRDLL